ncbi:MAG: glycoside hydrolase family 16 protein [Verrucomicrobiota bacterium]|nr:glycoside hydrolase family 16 protein [Verrucomicrobiota bacterium]
MSLFVRVWYRIDLKPTLWVFLFFFLAINSSLARAPLTSGWTLVWSDEFDGTNGSAPKNTNWLFDFGGHGWGNNELQSYTSRRTNSWIQDGNLVIQAIKETYTGNDGITRQYTSARLKSQTRQSWAYGRIEARIKPPTGQGVWPAFWTLGDEFATTGWPICGEIDIMENNGREPGRNYGTLHGPGYSGANNLSRAFLFPPGVTADQDYHLYAVEWETNVIRWSVDNQVYFSLTPANLPPGTQWVFTKPHFLLLNIAVGGNWPGPPDSSTVFPKKMFVDYVRVYARSQVLPPVLEIMRNGTNQPSIRWSGHFPHARLIQYSATSSTWVPLIPPSELTNNFFQQPVPEGFFGLSWPLP